MKYIAYFLLFVFSILSYSQEGAYKYSFTAKLKDISDGDTATVALRLYGIDTPEKKQMCETEAGQCYPCGLISTQALQSLVNQKDVTIKLTGDTTWGRMVGTVEKSGKDLNLEMIKRGHAVAYLRYLKGDMKKLYKEAQAEAKQAKKGIWQGKFIKPSDWRNKGHRLDCEK